MIDGVSNSPYDLGVLQLDRSGPMATSISLTPTGGAVEADWIQSDDRSGTDPAAPVTVEVNASPAADASGAWLPFAQQPDPGDGRKIARTSLAGLPDGLHLVRARTRDRAGNFTETALGATLADSTPPTVSGVAVFSGPNKSRIVELSYRADDGVGVGLAPVRPNVALVGAGDDADLSYGTQPYPGRVSLQLPGPGAFTVTVRVRDRLGNRGESAPVTIRVPSNPLAFDTPGFVSPPIATSAGEAPSADVAWAYRQARAFHARRGVRLRAQLRVGRTRAEWRALLGGRLADRFAGYADLRGAIALGPAVTGAIASLRGAHGGPRGTFSRADADAAVMGLAVLLHETIHATGPTVPDDSLTTRSGRAFEEGFTEAATDDLLWVFATGLRLPPSVRAPLAAAVNRRRPAYGPEVRFARLMSARATKHAGDSAQARAWRISVADTWGADRWARLSKAVGRTQPLLRIQAASRTTAGAQR